LTQIPPEITSQAPPKSKLPELILGDPAAAALYAFPPNRETLGGTAYLLSSSQAGNILIDTPAWTDVNQAFLAAQGVRWLFLTHRGGIGQHMRAMQAALNCTVVIQEQEAYLLPELTLTTFHHEGALGESEELAQVIWTAGHSPGSACLYTDRLGGILFTGRHLLPDRQAQPAPLRTAKTFHWPRQLRNVAMLRDRFAPSMLAHICPGASIGFLRGAGTITAGGEKLHQLQTIQE
jgi:glyoxylase-like metal-dependent hydrolase (beta-lactamase superfamily II)